jgi:hypothetical protein
MFPQGPAQKAGPFLLGGFIARENILNLSPLFFTGAAEQTQTT